MGVGIFQINGAAQSAVIPVKHTMLYNHIVRVINQHRAAIGIRRIKPIGIVEAAVFDNGCPDTFIVQTAEDNAAPVTSTEQNAIAAQRGRFIFRAAG